MVDKISVQIALEGGDEVEKQLAAIGQAGDKAFAGVNEAGTTAAEGIAKVGEASETTAEQTNKLTESTSKLSLETVKTSAEIAAATAKIALHGVEIVQAVRHHDTLLQSLLKLVTGFNTASRVVAAFTPELALVGVTFGSTAAAIAAGVVAFEALEKVVTKIAAADEKLNNTLQTLAATSGTSFDELQRGEAAFGQIGIKAETFRATIAKVQETLAGTDTTNLTRGMQDVVALVNQIAAGDKTITFANWVTAEDKIKGVAIAMKQAADSGNDATTVLLEFVRNADLATAIKIGAAFGLSEADVDRVRRLNENISDLTQRIKGAGPLISPENAAAFDRMRTSIANADAAWERLKQSINTTDFQAMAANFSSVMHDMKAAALNGAAAISEAMGRAFSGMGSQAASDVAAIKDALSTIGAGAMQVAQQIGAVDMFKQMQADAVTANAAVASFVGSVMQGMGASAASIQAVKDSINGIAPAASNAGSAAQQAGVMFTQWGTVAQQGANTAQAGIQQTSVMFTSFGTVASQSAQQAKTSMEQAAGGGTTLSAAIQGGSDKVAAFASQIAGIVWTNISSVGVAAWNALTGAISSAYDWLLKYIGLRASAPPVASSGGGAPGKAQGGMIGGRGTGTSDSNLAWLSRGEYVMPARAVRQPGVLALLEALRSGRIPGFADGGAVGGGDGGGGGGGILGQILQLGQQNNQLGQENNQLGQENNQWGQQNTQAINAVDQNVNGIGQQVASLESFVGATSAECAKHSKDLGEKIDKLAETFNIFWEPFFLKKMPEHPFIGEGRGGTGHPGPIPFAAGGLLGGRGTGTSDSNLAWVSRGEHIMPARAVGQPGVLAFLEALRRSGGNLRGVLDGMGRFALGGMVPRMPAMAFAGGGLAGSQRNLGMLTLQVGGETVTGLTDARIAAALERVAVRSQISSGGRKPSRYS